MKTINVVFQASTEQPDTFFPLCFDKSPATSSTLIGKDIVVDTTTYRILPHRMPADWDEQTFLNAFRHASPVHTL